jgi:hypothetical protein
VRSNNPKRCPGPESLFWWALADLIGNRGEEVEAVMLGAGRNLEGYRSVIEHIRKTC